MGNLRPIGSEKLQGVDKINRIIEIARYKENIPKSINEDKSVEYSKLLSDNNKYQIVKEKNGYVITKSINESEYDYIEPIKNRRFYSSYSQAMKRLNLIAKEANVSSGYDKNVSLFTEDEDVKYYLKMNANEQASPESVPTPAPAAAPAPAPAPTPELPAEDVPETEPEMDMDMEELPDENEGNEEEKVTFKTIQKLTGKLAQKLRVLSSDEEEKMSSKDIKYVINSVLSALDLDSLESEDMEDIVSKFEGEEIGDEPSDEEEMSPEMGDEEEVAPEAPQEPEGEMGEEFGDEKYRVRGARKRRIQHEDISDEDAYKMEDMLEGLFTESKVDDILKKYFKIDQKEKSLLEQKGKEKQELSKQVKKISTNIVQEVAALKFIKKNSNAKLLGRTVNKNIILQVENKKIKITPKGNVI